MHFFKLLLIITILIPFVSSQTIIGNSKNNIGISLNPSQITTSTSSGSNVTSVSSGDGCIFVSPTTGNVIVTFNTSCGSGGLSTIIALAPYLNSTTSGSTVSINFNESRLNSTILLEGLRNGFNISSNPFDQILNTTSNVTFDSINTTKTINQKRSSHLDIYQSFWNSTTEIFRLVQYANGVLFYGVNNGAMIISNDDFTNNIEISEGTNPTRITTSNGFEVQDLATNPLFSFKNATGLRANRIINASGEIYVNNGTPVSKWLYNQSDGSYNASYVVDTGDTMTGALNWDFGVLADYLVFKVFTVPVGRVTSLNNRLEMQSLFNLDFFFSNDDYSGAFIIRDNSLSETNGSRGFRSSTNDITTFWTNSSGTNIYGNATITGNLSVLSKVVLGETKIIGNGTASVDFCNGDGKCLNQTIKDPNTFRNGTLLYWNNNTMQWSAIAKQPANDQYPLFCVGTGGGWTFVSRSGGICPL